MMKRAARDSLMHRLGGLNTSNWGVVSKRTDVKRELAPHRDTIQGMSVRGKAKTPREMCQWSMERVRAEEPIVLTQQRGVTWRSGRRVCRQFQRCVGPEHCHMTTQNQRTSFRRRLRRRRWRDRIEGRHTPLY